ncbi:MAG: 6-phosphogluconolactonase [Candidatus Eisenbacteria sp.]|nr:6-phosphogluconolactonase [Candidatus Eisenbacteria bacterium]
MQPELVLTEGAGGFALVAAGRIAAEMNRIVNGRGICTVAVSGGDTPRPVYEKLASEEFSLQIPWNKTHLLFSDERCVPPEDSASNYRMVYETLLGNGRLSPAGIERIRGEEENRQEAAREYENRLPAELDLLLLGMGVDGHTASLFPGSPALDETTRRVLPVEGPISPRFRITITRPVIETARSIIVLVAGEAKAEMVARAIEGPYDPRKIPAQLALGGTWILDRAAAGRLTAK